MKKILWVLCALFLGVSCKAEAFAADVSAVQEKIRERFEIATEAYQGQVYIDDLQIPVSTENEEALTELCDALLEEIPSSYYVFRVYFENDNSSDYYRKINFISSMKNENGELDLESLLAYENAVDHALSYIMPEMSDLDKALVLYDYVMKSCEYDDYSASGSSTAYGALVDGLAVCQGYALAYMDLLDRVDVEAKYVRSNAMNHGWCLVKIDGNWYHADPTWDDKGGSEVGYEYFLRSDAEMEERMHSDWMTYYLPEVGASNAFDDCIFRSSSVIAYHNGAWYYVAEDGGIYSSDIRKNNQQKCLEGTELYYTYFMKDKVYLVNTTGICVAEAYDFDAMTPVKTWAEVYPNRALRVKSAEVSGGILNVSVQFDDSGETDVYCLEVGEDKQPEQTGFVVAFESDCNTVIPAKEDVTKGSLLEEPEVLTKDGYTFMGWCADSGRTSVWDFTTDTVEGNIMLYAKWKPKEIFLENDDINLSYGGKKHLYLTEEVIGMNYVWESADESVATVTQDGLVQSVSKGSTTIKVYLQEDPSVYAICQVYVRAKCSISLSPYWTELNIYWGGQQTFTATVNGSTTEDTTVTWTSGDESIVQVADGVVTGVGHGTTNVLVEAPGTDANPFTITIEVAQNYSLDMNYGQEEYTLNVGDREEVTVSGWSRLEEKYVLADAIIWTAEDESIAEYEDGYIVAKGAGETTITVDIPGKDADPIIIKVTVHDNSSEPAATPAPTASPEPTDTPAPSAQEAQVYAFVERMYTVALGREAEAGGIEYWQKQLLAYEIDGAGIAQGFILSPEFKGRNYDDTQYLQVLYRTFFNRDADAEGAAYWSQMISSGKSREYVLAGFVNSEEFDELCSAYGISRGFMQDDGTAINPGICRFAERLYTKVLERDGEKDGVEYWAIRIANGTDTPESAAKGFFASGEYLAKNTGDEKYIQTLYLTFMDREGEPDGIAYWKKVLSSGTSRDEVLSEFAASDEFKFNKVIIS